MPFAKYLKKANKAVKKYGRGAAGRKAKGYMKSRMSKSEDKGSSRSYDRGSHRY